MNLELNSSVADGYTSKGYIAGLVTEAWATENLYCINCSSAELNRERPNSPVRDFTCPSCSATYQLKAKNGKHGRVVSNSAYDKKIAAIDQNQIPHYAFLAYNRARWRVTGLFVVPAHLIGRGVIQRRNPLGPHARRAGWVGSNILLSEVPEEGRIWLVVNGEINDATDVRSQWAKLAFLATDDRASQGWGADVFSRVKRIVEESSNREFTLRAFNDRFHEDLSTLHPENHHIQAKIRQQMQVLRDGGLLEFVDNRGTYSLSCWR